MFFFIVLMLEDSKKQIAVALGSFLDHLDEGVPFSIVYAIEENHWNGTTSIQLNIKDIKLY